MGGRIRLPQWACRQAHGEGGEAYTRVGGPLLRDQAGHGGDRVLWGPGDRLALCPSLLCDESGDP